MKRGSVAEAAPVENSAVFGMADEYCEFARFPSPGLPTGCIETSL